ncbi:MAG: DUF697 domain-containing protein [Gammaproteobacteria bacterium]|nr:DUF697 domain-containing protein [Gammaproteobacteria bacterium]
MRTNAQTWQAPVFFELEELEEAPKEIPDTSAYIAPIILPENAKLESDAEVIKDEQGPEISETPPDAGEEEKPPAWIFEKITLPVVDRAWANAFSPLSWLLGSLGVFLVFLLLVDTYRFLQVQYSASLFIGTLFLLMIFSIGGAAGWLAWRAWKDIQALRTVSALQEQGQGLLNAESYGDATKYVNKLAGFYLHRPDVSPQIDRFFVIVDSSHHDGEVCALFSMQVLKPLDEQAYRIVVKRANETALMVMISPIALLSTLITLWRTMRMIREIASVYGGRPGFFASFSLIGAVIHSLLYADVSELAADSMAETFGGSMMSVLSAQMAQGMGSSVMTARVGLKAIHACRPMPFTEETKPRLKDIRREVFRSLKQFIGNKNETAAV